jgi:predicted ATP-grasp superfamily ATP-dependent carboligase
MFPKSGGGGVVNVTTERPDLVKLARELLEPMDWHGVAQIEFIDGPETDEPKLIEVNPKVWGTTELSIAAGVDFPRYLCKVALGEEVTGKVSDYNTGLHFIWYEGGLLGNLYQSDGIVGPLRDVLDIRRGNCASNIDSTDVLPHVVRLPQLGLLGAKHLVRQ